MEQPLLKNPLECLLLPSFYQKHLLYFYELALQHLFQKKIT